MDFLRYENVRSVNVGPAAFEQQKTAGFRLA
jgi:hypothetical protein